MRAKSWRFAVTTFFCVGVAGYAIWAYGGGVQRVPVHPAMAAAFDEHRVLITVHAIGASLALILGPFQFVDGLRSRAPQVHRVLGYIYLLLGVGVGGSAGILMARFSFGGFVSHLGFGMLGCLWIFTGAMAISAARRRRFDDHRKWMERSFALALAAVTLRLYIPASVAVGIRFEEFYPAVAWLCWVPNLIVTEWCQKRPNQCPQPPLRADD
ncbi:MAG: hypothetical protein RIQ93_2997 [Verrucomicrobiota bacterium]|jgi:uncharacterized membrane protein